MIAEDSKALSESKPKRFRLVVRSAEEAVRMIRDKLGDNARVVSVRQIGGEGLKRFISSPKLEVIAEVPQQTESLTQDNGEVMPSIESEGKTQGTQAPSRVSPGSTNSGESPKHKTAPVETQNEQVDALKILTKAGFDEALISQIKTWPEVGELSDLSLADVLRKVTLCLSDRFKTTPTTSLSSKVALLGSPGVGKTTMLCKLLAHEVFIKKKVPMVLKLENGVPNPDDSLRIFCEVIGVTLYRESNKIPPPSLDCPLFIDIPGISINNTGEWSSVKSSLKALDVNSRILVVNGAYDVAVLSKCIRIGSNLDATHLAITHFDELSNASKLWPLILDAGITPYCVSTGQNVTGDFSSNVLNQMIAKSFPENLYSQTFSSYQRG